MPGGAVIDITDGLDVVVGDAEPTTMVRISNVSPIGSKDLIIDCSMDSGGTVMNYTPTYAGTPIGPRC